MKHLLGLALICCLLVNVALSQDRSRSRYVPQPSEDYDYDGRSPPEAETPPPRRQQQRRLRQPSSQSQTPAEKPTFSRETPREQPPSPPPSSYRGPPQRTYREPVVPHPTGLDASHQDTSSLRLRQQGGPVESPAAGDTPYEVTRRQPESSTLSPERPQRRRRPAKRRRPQKVEEVDEPDSEKPGRSHGHQRTRPQISSSLENDPHRPQIHQPDTRPIYNEGSLRPPQNPPPRVHTIPVNTDEENGPSRHHLPQHSSLSGDTDEQNLPPHVRQPLLQHQTSANRLPVEHSDSSRDYPSGHSLSYEEHKSPESFPRPQQESVPHPLQPYTPDQSSNVGEGYHPGDHPLPAAPHPNSQNELPLPPPPGRYEPSGGDRYNPTDDKRGYSSYQELNPNSQRDPAEKRQPTHPSRASHRESPAPRDNAIHRNTQTPSDAERPRQRTSRPTRIETRVVRVQGQRNRGSDNERTYEIPVTRRLPEEPHRSTARRIQAPRDSEVRLPPQQQPILAPQISSPEEPKRHLYTQRQTQVERVEIPRDRSIDESDPGYPVPSNRLPDPEKVRYESKPAAFSYTTGDISQYNHPLRPDLGPPVHSNHGAPDDAPHEPVHSEPIRTHSRPLNRLPHDSDDEEIRGAPPPRTQPRSNSRTYQREQDSAPLRTRSHDSPPRAESSRQSAPSQRAGSRYQGSNPAEESLSDTLRTPSRQDESQRSHSHGYRSRPQYETSPEERAANSPDVRHADANSRSSSRSPQRQPSHSSASSVRRENISPRSQNNYDHSPSQPRTPPRQEQAPPRSNSRFQCPEPYGFFPDSRQCDKYYECHNGTAVESLCMDGLAFNLVSSPKYLRCDSLRDVDCNSRSELQEAQPSKNCPRRFGLYPHETDCTKFWNCVDGAATEVQCPPGLVYHDTKATCDWADLVTGTCKTEDLLGFTCPEPTALDLQDGVYSRYPHPSDCRLHFTCIKGNDGLRRPRMLSCNDGSVFDPSSGSCTRAEEVPGCEEYYGPVVKKKPPRNQQRAREEPEEPEDRPTPSSRRRPSRRPQGRYEA